MFNLSALPDTLAPYFTDGIKIILRIFLAVTVIIFLIYAILAVTHPYPLDYGEAPLIDQAMRLAAGQNIYRPDIDSPPYTITNYPPLYVLSLVPFLNISESPFQVGRVVSVVATLASALFLSLTIYTFSKDRLAAFTTGIFFLGIPYIVYWSGLARIDSLALAFATAALYVLARWPRTRGGLVGGGLLLVAAVYTRQSYALAAPLGGFVWLWTQERRKALELTAVVGGVGLLLFLVLNTITRGGFFLHIVTANVNEFGMERLWDKLTNLWETAPTILVLGGVFLFTAWRRVQGWPLLGAFLVGALLSALTIGKIGSNVNYFLELSAALSLVAGACLVWSKQHPWRYTAVTLLVVLQLGILLEGTMGRVDWYLIPHRGDFNTLQMLDQAVKDLDGIVLADEYMGMLTMQNRPLYIQPFEVTQLANAGLWDQTPLLEDIAEQQFDGILIHHFDSFPVHKERWTPEMLAAIEKYYQPTKTLAGTVVFLPQGDTEISRVPPPTHKTSFSPSQMILGPLHPISDMSNYGQPHIAVNPTNPDHLAAIVTSVSKFNCELPDCIITLSMYTSMDSGKTWSEDSPFTRGQQVVYNGLVAFGPDGTLYALGIRDGIIVLNESSSEADYEMTLENYEEVTKAQVAAKPWLRIDPRSGQLFLTLDAQGGDLLYVTPSLLRSDVKGRPWSPTTRIDQRVSIADFSNGRTTWPDDIQVLFGEGTNVSLVWTWDPEPWSWPRTVWMANSTDGGESFGEPAPILETWGPINTTSSNGQFAIVYRTGTEETQQLAVAATSD
ncbi:MAG: hypothetical protein ACE5GO_08395, partial [Anaerolineales bacterium]